MGRMVADGRNGLQISYNLANLPSKVEGMAGSASAGLTLSYGYLSDGTKVSALASQANGGVQTGIRYRGNFVYEVTADGNERLQSVPWAEGRIVLEHYDIPEVTEFGGGEETVIGGEFDTRVCWHVTDHIGSTREVVLLGAGLSGREAVVESNGYLPFGTRVSFAAPAGYILTGKNANRYRFSGKEEQRFGWNEMLDRPAFNLGLLDFGARHYDPFTCRWTTTDPLAGKYHSLSPYNYCAGNPVRFVDPDGCFAAQLFGIAVGAAVEVASQVTINLLSGDSIGDSLKNVDWLDVGVAAAEGAITAGTSAIKSVATKTAIRVATSAVSGAVQGKFNYDTQDHLKVNTNEQAAFTAAMGAIAGGANLGGKTVHLQNTRTNKSVVEAARNAAKSEGKSFTKEEAKNIAAKNTARNASVKATNKAATDVVDAAKMTPVYLPNSYIWKKVNDEETKN